MICFNNGSASIVCHLLKEVHYSRITDGAANDGTVDNEVTPVDNYTLCPATLIAIQVTTADGEEGH